MHLEALLLLEEAVLLCQIVVVPSKTKISGGWGLLVRKQARYRSSNICRPGDLGYGWIQLLGLNKMLFHSDQLSFSTSTATAFELNGETSQAKVKGTYSNISFVKRINESRHIVRLWEVRFVSMQPWARKLDWDTFLKHSRLWALAERQGNESLCT